MTDFIHIPTRLTLIVVEKIDTAPDPISCPTPWDQWIDGSFENQNSLPISYRLRGYLMRPIRRGMPIEVFRIQRNEVHAFGFFRSTPIVDIREHGLIETFNSIYRISYPSVSRKEAR